MVDAQIDAVMNELKGNVFGNPHSPAPSSLLTDTEVESVRERILKYFNADPGAAAAPLLPCSSLP